MGNATLRTNSYYYSCSLFTLCFFEADGSLLFGFLIVVLCVCVIFAKVLGASLYLWICRILFRRLSSSIEWAHANKYFHILNFLLPTVVGGVPIILQSISSLVGAAAASASGSKISHVIS
ncbi:hypothetical protein MKW92_044899 [Papaver armeniacum]|nr:hypothetical protein MKW92_044899 [Papaver armeniacum]